MAGTTQYFGISYPTATDYVKDGASNMQTIATGFDSAVAIPTYNNQTGTSYTFVLADAAKTVTSNNVGAVTFTIPPQSSVAWADGTTLTIRNYGAGAVTFAGGSGVTVTNTASTVAQYGSAKVVRTGSNAWTVLPDSGGASGALTYIGGSTFSAQTSVSYNNVFTSTYENYKIIFNGRTSGSDDINLRVRASGTDYSSSNYNFTTIERAGAGFFTNAGVGTVVILGLGRVTKTDIEATIYSPQVASTTTSVTTNGMYLAAGSAHANTLFAAAINSTAQYDGFTIYPAAGTITGTIRIYGISNS